MEDKEELYQRCKHVIKMHKLYQDHEYRIMSNGSLWITSSYAPSNMAYIVSNSISITFPTVITGNWLIDDK